VRLGPSGLGACAWVAWVRAPGWSGCVRLGPSGLGACAWVVGVRAPLPVPRPGGMGRPPVPGGRTEWRRGVACALDCKAACECPAPPRAPPPASAPALLAPRSRDGESLKAVRRRQVLDCRGTGSATHQRGGAQPATRSEVECTRRSARSTTTLAAAGAGCTTTRLGRPGRST